MKVITITIDSCVKCPHYIEHTTFDHREYCEMIGQYFVRGQPIPAWCPLPEKETKNENDE